MATFTMNSQRNFVQAPVSKNIFDKAFAFSVALVVLVGGIWAAERILIYVTNKQIAEYEAVTQSSFDSVQTEDVQAVHDVTSRLTAIQGQAGEKVDVQNILGTLEKSTIPQVRLTEYEYLASGVMNLKGVVSDYRFLAEQVLRYRQEALFSTAEVKNTDRSEEGQITFDIEITPAPVASEVDTTSDPLL